VKLWKKKDRAGPDREERATFAGKGKSRGTLAYTLRKNLERAYFCQRGRWRPLARLRNASCPAELRVFELGAAQGSSFFCRETQEAIVGITLNEREDPTASEQA